MIPSDIPQPPPIDPPPQDNPPPNNLPPPNIPEPPITVRPTELEQQLASMDFIESVVEKHGFHLGNVYDFAYTITSLDQAPGKDHLQGTVRRTFTCIAQSGKTQKFIIEQKINVSVRVPDLKYMDEQTVQETKMKALFAIDGHEFRIQNAFRGFHQTGVNKKIEALRNKTLMRVSFRRESLNKGLYGKAVRREESPWPTGFKNKLVHALSQHGSIKGAVVDNADTTDIVNYKSKWKTFESIPCPALQTRRTQIDKLINDVADITGAPQFDLQQFLKNIEDFPEGVDKQKLNIIKQQLLPGSNFMSAHEMLTTLEREINHKADALKIQLTQYRWEHSNASVSLSVISHNDIGAGFGKYTREIKKIDAELKKLGNPPPDEYKEYQQQLLNARANIEKYSLSVIRIQEQSLTQLTKYMQALNFLLACCTELMKDNEIKVHQENLEYLKNLIQKTQLSERVAGMKNDFINVIGYDFTAPPS